MYRMDRQLYTYCYWLYNANTLSDSLKNNSKTNSNGSCIGDVSCLSECIRVAQLHSVS